MKLPFLIFKNLFKYPQTSIVSIVIIIVIVIVMIIFTIIIFTIIVIIISLH